MKVGLVGKPNSGKSTFFASATAADAQIGDYPFTTIDSNVGIAHVRRECPCSSLGVTCEPHNSPCLEGTRYLPVELVDVAGLVPGGVDVMHGESRPQQHLETLDDGRMRGQLTHLLIRHDHATVICLPVAYEFVELRDESDIEVCVDQFRQDEIAFAVEELLICFTDEDGWVRFGHGKHVLLNGGWWARGWRACGLLSGSPETRLTFG